ncbi:L,D-transpeptidase family protein [Myxococcota bacterium]|nr:L,D-transpeptidase family protein [Myxococcota bacterium]
MRGPSMRSALAIALITSALPLTTSRCRPDGAARLESIEPALAAHLARERPAGLSRELHATVRALYAARAHAPIWLRGPFVRSEAPRLIERVRDTALEGLEPTDYLLPELERAWADLADAETIDAREAALVALEETLTGSWLVLSAHVARGRVDPETSRPRDAGRAELEALATRLDAYARTRRLDLAVERLTPTTFEQPALRRELARLARGDTPSDGATLTDTARRARIDALRVNLERRRWLPEDLGPRWVIVNVPRATLEAHVDGRPNLSLRVVVGQRLRETPLFSSTIESVVLNPSWYVPASIAREEIVEAVKRDPSYLDKRKIRVYTSSGAAHAEVDPDAVDWHDVEGGPLPFRLRQEPGPRNALGRIKFQIPNEHGVYLHDTPSRSLFDRARRTLSHGCIRVEDPFALADLLFDGDPAWPPGKLRATAEASSTRTIPIAHPAAVHLVYWTVWVDPDGVVRFGDDVYQLDRAVLRGLGRARRTPAPEAAASTAPSG